MCHVRSIRGDANSKAVSFIEELKTNQAVIEHGIIPSQTLKCVSHVYTWIAYDRAMERDVQMILFIRRSSEEYGRDFETFSVIFSKSDGDVRIVFHIKWQYSTTVLKPLSTTRAVGAHY